MKRLAFAAIALIALTVIISCDDTETYADQKEEEQAAINSFIKEQKIKVITENTFKEQGYKTDTAQNEYVLMKNSGVYMQIVREGCGEKIKQGETATVLCRFTEYNLLTDSLQLSNEVQAYHYLEDQMTVTNTSGTFTASFISDHSLMYSAYSSAAVPSGWLVPFAYIKIGRPETADDEIAKVRLIVPHNQGHIYATNGVYPCYYLLLFQRGK